MGTSNENLGDTSHITETWTKAFEENADSFCLSSLHMDNKQKPLDYSDRRVRLENDYQLSKMYNELPLWTKYAFEIILVLIVFPDNLAVTPMSDAFMHKACLNHLHFNESICSHLDDHKLIKEQVQIESNFYSTLRNIVSTLPGCLISLISGQYMSRYGIRGSVLIAIVGKATTALLHAYTFHQMNLHLKYNVYAEIPAAITGDMIVVMSAVYSHISLNCPISQRQTRFLSVQFATFLPLSCAMSIGGILYDRYHIPMMYLQLTIAVFFVLPMSVLLLMYRERDPAPETENDSLCEIISQSIRFDVVKQSLRYLVRQRPDHARPQLFAMFVCAIICIIAFSGTTELNFYYVNLIYGWKVSDFTFMGAVVNALTVAVAIPNLLLFRWLELSDPTMAALCFLCYSIKFALLSVAILSVYVYYLQILPGLPYMVLNISVQSHISRLLAPEEIPVIFAMLSASEHLFPIASDWFNMLLYKWAVSVFPGLPFAVQSILFLVAAALASLCEYWTEQYGYPVYDSPDRKD